MEVLSNKLRNESVNYKFTNDIYVLNSEWEKYTINFMIKIGHHCNYQNVTYILYEQSMICKKTKIKNSMTFQPFCEQYNKGNVQYPPENRYDAILKE